MAISVAADPCVITSALPSGSFVEGVAVIADPCIITFAFPWAHGTVSHTPASARNPELDKELVLGYTDNTTGLINITILGTWLGTDIDDADIGLTVTIHGEPAFGVLVTDSVIDIVLSVGQNEDGTGTEFVSAPQIVVEQVRRNWVKWSNIGHLDFTIGRDNVAGERPMDWKGWVYSIRKLGNRVAVYGQNGVSLMVPNGNAWGLQTIYTLGLKGKQAVTGRDDIHWFIDKENNLCVLSEGIEKLGYSEYLSTLSSPVMSWDNETGLIYICDGTNGFVYNHADRSLGEGPTNITGIHAQSGTLYAVSPATISTPTFQICTDIYDFGTRRAKTIRSVELGTDLSNDLYVALDYRRDTAADWSTTDWRIVNNFGIAYITCFGTEFRIKVKTTTYEYLEIDYITVNGEAHVY